MLFGSAIFIFILLYITVLLFYVLFVSELWKSRTSSCQRMWLCTWTKSSVRFWLFTFTCFFTKSWNFFFPLQMCSPLHRWTTFLISLSFYTTDCHRNTNTRTCLSWTWACWHSLIMYVLCCCTCPNTNIIVTICFSFVCLVTLVFIRPLLMDFRICQMVHKTPICSLI